MKTHLLEGLPDPQKRTVSSAKDIDKRLSRIMRHYSLVDPSPKREKVILLGLVIDMGEQADTSVKSQCTADLIQIGLFFCLRSCEYTKTGSHRCTTQFCFWDMQFHNAAGIIPGDVLDQDFLDAWAITLFLDTQKNYIQVESTSMEATGLKHGDAVSAAARRFIYLLSNSATPNTPVCMYYTSHGSTPSSIPSHHITRTLCAAAHKLGFQKLGFFPHEIGSHSLRSGGAMTLHLTGVPEHTIVIGRWRSDAFLIYLHGQITTFTQGIAAAMVKAHLFKHTTALTFSHP